MKKTSDPIERQDAIDAIAEMGFQKTSTVKAILCRLETLPSAQPERRYDEWCTDCKEYDHERHCCPRFNHVIRTTLQEVRKKGKWIDVNGDGSLYECDQCHDLSCCVGKYCMECGARMEVGNDE